MAITCSSLFLSGILFDFLSSIWKYKGWINKKHENRFCVEIILYILIIHFAISKGHNGLFSSNMEIAFLCGKLNFNLDITTLNTY